MNRQEALNVAWHARANGLDSLTPEHILGALAQLELMAEKMRSLEQDLSLLSTVVERTLEAIKGRPFRQLRSVYRSIAERRRPAAKPEHGNAGE